MTQEPLTAATPGWQPHGVVGQRWRAVALEYGLPFLAYLILAILLAWPVARDFTTHYASDGQNDPRQSIWTLWYTRQAMLGAEPLFYAATLYYPVGITLLTNSPGPLLGLLALPFWPL